MLLNLRAFDPVSCGVRRDPADAAIAQRGLNGVVSRIGSDAGYVERLQGGLCGLGRKLADLSGADDGLAQFRRRGEKPKLAAAGNEQLDPAVRGKGGVAAAQDGDLGIAYREGAKIGIAGSGYGEVQSFHLAAAMDCAGAIDMKIQARLIDFAKVQIFHCH